MASAHLNADAAGLVGRSRECAVIDGLLEAASRGESSSLVLRADAGMGKTSLLRYAAERATAMTVLSGTGVEAESDLDFAGLHSLVRPIVEHLPRLPVPQRDAVAAALGLAPAGGADRFLVSAGALSLPAAAAEKRPILCVIDDAQWLDVPSADSLVFAAPRPATSPMRRVPAGETGARRSSLFQRLGSSHAVVGGPGGVNLVVMRLRPVLDRTDDGEDRPPERGELVVDADRDRRCDGAAAGDRHRRRDVRDGYGDGGRTGDPPMLSRPPDGGYELRPDQNTTPELRDTIERLDPFALYQRLTCPLLVICAMAQPPAPPSMPWLAELHHAHHADLNERFARFTAGRPGVRIDRVESTHARILLEPGLSSMIDRFLLPAGSHSGEEVSAVRASGQ